MALAPLNLLGTYLGRLDRRRHDQNDCTLILMDLKVSDAALYYFTYRFGNVTGTSGTCNGGRGVRLRVLASAASVRVEEIVGGERVGVAQQTVTEGQRITLTCVPTCAPNNTKPGVIWYKNRLQLNDRRANARFLSLDPIGNEDTGSYSCTLIGYANLPSSSANLSVQYSVRSTMPPAHTGQRLLKLSIAITSTAITCIGLFVAIMVAFLVLKMKRRKTKRTVGRKEVRCDPAGDLYASLDVKCTSDEYGTLDLARRCSAADEDDSDYENSSDASAGERQETIEMS